MMCLHAPSMTPVAMGQCLEGLVVAEVLALAVEVADACGELDEQFGCVGVGEVRGDQGADRPGSCRSRVAHHVVDGLNEPSVRLMIVEPALRDRAAVR